MHLYNVIPCISRETAIEVMNKEKEDILDSPRYTRAREWMRKAWTNECPYEWSESETGFFINVYLDAYAEYVEVKEKDIQF